MRKSAIPDHKMDPVLEDCRTSKVGAVIPGTKREMFYCRIDNANCTFAMPFGFDYICKHLNNHQFPAFDAGIRAKPRRIASQPEAPVVLKVES